MYARRRRRYFALMTVCLTLFLSATVFVRLVSVPIAVAMCVVAAMIPPVAAIVGNRREADEAWFDEEPGPDQRTPDEELWEEEMRGYRRD
ncbi:DUF3099 domain-containing protein [Streptomyces durbertensis]|uniref:DUF3099 domain-containing protein n=1 Tax=Streptomyces durbertensis TaxID=2448886 RepID=A0ABR6EES9_9ACTN|nr:DUF3099 domain-containing protein [Streptomyces durbertensis]MBB1243832.1 DUF3099 domain-containing protein [Streptomyces durbertensis]